MSIFEAFKLRSYCSPIYKTHVELFLLGDVYYRFNTKRLEVDSGYPIKTSRSFLKCPQASDIFGSQARLNQISSSFILVAFLIYNLVVI